MGRVHQDEAGMARGCVRLGQDAHRVPAPRAGPVLRRTGLCDRRPQVEGASMTPKPRSRVEKVAEEMHGAFVTALTAGGPEYKRSLWNSLEDFYRQHWIELARWHLRELRKARGRTVGYVAIDRSLGSNPAVLLSSNSLHSMRKVVAASLAAAED